MYVGSSPAKDPLAPKATELTPRKDGGMRIAGQMEMSAIDLDSYGRSRFDSGAIHQARQRARKREKLGSLDWLGRAGR